MEPLTYGRLWALRKAWVFTVSEEFQPITVQDQVKGRIHTATGTSLCSGPWQGLYTGRCQSHGYDLPSF